MGIQRLTREVLQETGEWVVNYWNHPDYALQHSHRVRVYLERLRLYDSLMSGVKGQVSRSMLDEFDGVDVDFADIGQVGHFPEWEKDKVADEKSGRGLFESLSTETVNEVDEWEALQKVAEMFELDDVGVNKPSISKQGSEPVKDVFAELAEEINEVATDVVDKDSIEHLSLLDLSKGLAFGGFADYKQMSDVILENHYVNGLELVGDFERKLPTVLDKTTLRMQIDNKGNAYLNLNGVVTRREVLTTIFGLVPKSELETNYKYLFKRSGLEGEMKFDLMSYICLLLLGNTVSDIGDIKKVYSSKLLDLPVTRLELALILERFGYIGNNTNISLSYLSDLKDATIYVAHDVDVLKRANQRGLDIESYIALLLNDKEPLVLTDVTRVATMLEKFGLLSEDGVSPLERVNRLEFTIIFGELGVE